MSIEWYFGQPDQYPMDRPMAYQKGINFQCSEDFVRTFQTSSRWLYSTLQAGLSNETGNLYMKRQRHMHMSLSYLCCLRRNETDWAREVMYKWVQEASPFGFDVGFDKVECWHEGQNSVTTIIVADERTQRVLASMNHELNQRLEQVGIPIAIQRDEQMPYHVTLQGIRYGKDYSSLPENDITSQLPLIFDTVSDLSKTVGRTWTGPQASFLRSVGRMVVSHAPYFAFEGTLHTGKEGWLPN